MPSTFISKSVSKISNSSGSKTSFQVIKGQDGVVHRIRGISGNNTGTYNIMENIMRQNKETGAINRKSRQFKIKTANIMRLMQSPVNSPRMKSPRMKSPVRMKSPMNTPTTRSSTIKSKIPKSVPKKVKLVPKKPKLVPKEVKLVPKEVKSVPKKPKLVSNK